MISTRPQPPAFTDELVSFQPAPELWDWAQATILKKGQALYNPDHEHLIEHTGVVFIWASRSFGRQGRIVLGQCEQIGFQCSGWKRERQEEQFLAWFGFMPKFMITLSADYCSSCSDTAFCSLVEHELYHMAHKQNMYGPCFDKDTGLPVLCMRGHDVEEFVGVTRRYGASPEVQRLIDAASQTPLISPVSVAQACGTCQLKVA